MSQKIVIINGNENGKADKLEKVIYELSVQLTQSGSSVKLHTLKDLEFKSCTGCWDCWWKTPGSCRFDDVVHILKDIINSDIVIYASPMIMGMYSALLKRFHDRTIPLIHPYIEIREGESHHVKRYPKYPRMGVILEEGDSTVDEIDNVRFIYDRIAINFHSEIVFFQTTGNFNKQEIINETSHI